MVVDLEALKSELESAGCVVEFRHGNELIVREDTERTPTWANVWDDGTGSFDGQYDWTLLDIIRRAVSPAPAGEEVPAVARWIADMENDQVHWQSDLCECLEALNKLPAHDQLGINPLSRETLRSLVAVLNGEGDR